MDQFGVHVASYGLPVTDTLAVPGHPVVLLPYRCLRENDPLPHSWDVTSDTIAAWVADSLGLDLLLLKSVDGISAGVTPRETVTTLLATDVVDPAFLPFVLRKKIAVSIINGSDPERVRRFLAGQQVRARKPVQPFKGSKRDTIGILGGAIMSDKKCTSCSAPLAEEGATEFGCPACGVEISPCYRCREQSIPYTCPKCGFGGP